MFRRFATAAITLAVLLWGGAEPPRAQDSRPTVMVVDFAVAVGWSPASEVVTDRVVARLREAGTVRVMSRSQTRAALQAGGLDLRGLLDVSDVSRVAARFGADYVLMGEVDQFDQTYSGGCLPIVGCVYTVTATVQLRGMVVDTETATVVARPEGQARGQQGAASVWVGPWWTHISVENFDRQLIGRVTDQAVSQFVTRARPAFRPKPPRAQPEQPGPEPTPAVERPAPTPAATPGGLERARVGFRRGDRVLLNEDFSGCSLRPAGWRTEGAVECVGFQGKKWLSAVKGHAWAERAIPGFEGATDFALEVTFFVQRVETDPAFVVRIGGRNSPFHFLISWCAGWRGCWSEKALPDVRGELVGRPVQLGILKQGETVHVFIDGVRALSDSVDSLTLSRQPPQLTLSFHNVDIEQRRYVLASDIVVSQF